MSYLNTFLQPFPVFRIVYGSPETWLGDERWRKMVSSDSYKKSVRAVAIDEAHIISHW